MKKEKSMMMAVIISLVICLTSGIALAEPYDGYTLFNPNGSRTTYLMDIDNRTVHTWNHDRSGGYSAYLTENGNLVRPSSVSNPRLNGGAYSGLIEVKDWDGNLIWDFEYNSATYITHHDIEPMPNGNVLAIAWEVKTAAEATQAGKSRAVATWPDHIIEVEPDGNGGGRIVWEWHAWDHLVQDYNANRDNYGVVGDHPELLDVNMGNAGGGPGGPGGGGDWLHINGISYNPSTDQIAISSHYMDEVYVIDHSTTTAEAASHEGGDWGHGGDILYRWGCPSNYDANGNSYLDVLHCAYWVPDGLPGAGNLMAFNNGEGSRQSSVVEITPPRDENGNYIIQAGQAFGPANPTWSYSNGGTFYSNHLGSCQRLPNGNTLISESTEGYLFEVDEDGNEVWNYSNRVEIARSLRYGLDYPGVFNLRDLDAGDIVINEFLADNAETIADQDGEYDGWIELYNNTDEEQSLTGFYLSNDADNPTLWQFPEISIAANDYLIIWTDNDLDQDGLHAGFELSADGGEIIFSALDESELDNVEYNSQATDQSWGRYPNGTGDFTEMEPTYAAENQIGEIPPDYSQLVINEILVDNSSIVTDPSGEYDSWIELFNNGNQSLPMNGLYLSTNAENPTQWTFPEVTIPANGYLIIWTDEDDDQEGVHASFTLSVEGGSLLLSNADSELIDNLSFVAQTTDVSFGRYPNGTGEFRRMVPTFEAENSDTEFIVGNEEPTSPDDFLLLGNYPNPFNPSTTISFRLAESNIVNLSVYDANGKMVSNLASQQFSAGNHDVIWNGQADNGEHVSSGVYLITLQCGGRIQTAKALLIQ